jgi:uncharacterized metal-binding protein YceD (DUF177 family)
MDNAFIIKFSGLKPGLHTFQFWVDDAFFSQIPHSPIQQGHLEAVVELEKRTDMLALDIRFQGTVHLPCDRCNELFDLPVEGEEQVLVKFTETPMEDEPELVYLPKGSTEFDCTQLLYELILLHLPMQRVHPDSDGRPGCPDDALERFEREPEPPVPNDDDEVGSIWEVLKDLD